MSGEAIIRHPYIVYLMKFGLIGSNEEDQSHQLSIRNLFYAMLFLLVHSYEEASMDVDTNYIREFAKNVYVRPAIARNESLIAIPVKAVESDLKKVGLPSGRTPMVCAALRGPKFQRENKLVLDHWDGPPSGQSTTVVFYYRRAGDAVQVAAESPAARAFRLTEKLRGLMKAGIAARGGTEGFIRWVRSVDSDDEDAA